MAKIEINNEQKKQLSETFNVEPKQLEVELEIIAKKYQLVTYAIACNWYNIANKLIETCKLELTCMNNVELGLQPRF